MPRFTLPDESKALKAQILLLWASLCGFSSKRIIVISLDSYAKTWDRWLSGRSSPPKPKLFDMAAKLLSENPKMSVIELFANQTNPQRAAWDWLISEISRQGDSTEPSVIRLLGANGSMINGSPSNPLAWRTFEMSLWVSAGIRLANFRDLDWDARIAKLRATARKERRFDHRIGWIDVNMPFDIVGRPAQLTGAALSDAQLNETGDIEIPLGRRRREV